MSKRYDVAVIGAGPGGYVCALRAAQRGLSTVCIDDFVNQKGEPSPGGTCLNVGCIPSKSLLQSSEMYVQLKHSAQSHGIFINGAIMDVPAMIRRKDDVVSRLTQGIGLLFKKHKITSCPGRATLEKHDGEYWLLSVKRGEETQAIQAKNVVIATGSRPRRLPGVEVDNQTILDNQGALALQECPSRLGVIGAGVIGLELGSVWNRLGAKVTLLEMADTFLPALEKRLSVEVHKQMTASGLEITLGVKINAIEKSHNEVVIRWQRGEEEHETRVDKLIMAIGRIPNLSGLNMQTLGLEGDERGGIAVDELCRTGKPGLWAIGDVVRGPMLAHKASAEGIIVADQIAGLPVQPLDFSLIPSVIYTHPEVAWAGGNEATLKQRGIEVKKGAALFAGNGRALALGEEAGRCVLYTDKNSDRLLGGAIVGPQASELINEIVQAMALDASGEALAGMVHAHPTLSETLHEAALALNKLALHG